MKPWERVFMLNVLRLYKRWCCSSLRNILFFETWLVDSCKSVYKTSTSHDLYASAHLIHITSKICNKITGDYAVIQSGMFPLQHQKSDEHIHWSFYTHMSLFVFIMGVVCREASECIVLSCQLTLHTHTIAACSDNSACMTRAECVMYLSSFLTLFSVECR